MMIKTLDNVYINMEDFSGFTIGYPNDSDFTVMAMKELVDNQTATIELDASNYKKHNEVIIPGTFTEEQIHTIIDCLQGGEYFIPSEVNLPEIRFEDRTEADHPWFELDEDGFEETEAKVTCHISPEDLVKLFLEKKKEWQDEFYMPADWM